jgi:hypothetical protein
MHAPVNPSSTCILHSWHSSFKQVAVPRLNDAASEEAVRLPYPKTRANDHINDDAPENVPARIATSESRERL